MSPLGSNRPRVTAARLKSLLDQAGETANNHQIVLIGHGDGFTMAQLFAHTYPSAVAGLAMLDGFPNLLRLQGRSNRDIFDTTTASCGTLNMLRALESVGVSRALLAYYWSAYSKSILGVSDKGVSWMDGKKFAPSRDMDAFKSTFNNGNYYAAIFNDYCLRQNTATQFTDRLSAVGTVQGQHTVKWPRLPPGVPVLMAVAGNTLTAAGDAGAAYQVQLQQFNSSLVWNSSLTSPTGYSYSRVVVCQQCDHSFPLESTHSQWLADEMNEFFSQFF